MIYGNHKDILGGAILVGVGLFSAAYGYDRYEIGELHKIGSGFFPVLLGIVLAGVGACITIIGFLNEATPISGIRRRPLVFIMIGVATFALSVETVGLVPAAVLLTVIISFSEEKVNLRESLSLGLFLAVVSVVIFSYALRVPLSAFNWSP